MYYNTCDSCSLSLSLCMCHTLCRVSYIVHVHVYTLYMYILPMVNRESGGGVATIDGLFELSTSRNLRALSAGDSWSASCKEVGVWGGALHSKVRSNGRHGRGVQSRLYLGNCSMVKR